MIYTLWQGNNQWAELDGMIDSATKFLADGVTLNPNPTYINNGVGTVQVLNSSGVPQIIGPSNATVSNAVYVTGSNGNYRFQITSDFVSPVGPGYQILMNVTAPGGFQGKAHPDAVVRLRKSMLL